MSSVVIVVPVMVCIYKNPVIVLMCVCSIVCIYSCVLQTTSLQRCVVTYKAMFWECIQVQVHVPANTAEVERTTARSLLDYTRGNRCGKSRIADLLR